MKKVVCTKNIFQQNDGFVECLSLALFSPLAFSLFEEIWKFGEWFGRENEIEKSECKHEI